ncbi:MAG: DUF3341 domain-containing protein [Bdellovibrionota bacterium]
MTTSQYQKAKAVFGVFETRMELEKTVDNLKAQGYRNSDISVLIPGESDEFFEKDQKETKASEGAATGAVGGLAFGGALGWLAGAGALAIPGIGPFVAAGPIMAAIAGAGIAGTVGGVAGALVGSGIPEDEAKKYESYVKEGAMLLSVHADDMNWMNKARLILQSGGAKDVTAVSEKDSKIIRKEINRGEMESRF